MTVNEQKKKLKINKTPSQWGENENRLDEGKQFPEAQKLFLFFVILCFQLVSFCFVTYIKKRAIQKLFCVQNRENLKLRSCWH